MVKDRHRCERASASERAARSGLAWPGAGGGDITEPLARPRLVRHRRHVRAGGRQCRCPAILGGGGELIDGGTFIAGPPEHIDPALNSTLDAYQVINAMYDGLTDIDVSDPEDTRIVPLLAETFEPNEDATVWTFTVKDGLTFADGEEILPSTFQRSWERAADIAGDYSYLFNFIEGGAERLAGEADTISGVVADDEAMTLTVTLSAPYSNFGAVAGFQLFFPVPEAADAAGDGYQEELMVGNGPYTMESPRSDEEIVLVRNDRWAGDFNGETWPSRPGASSSACSPTSTRRTTPSRPGEVDNATIPRRAPRRPGRTGAPPSTPPCWPRTTTCSTSVIRASGDRRTSCCARRSRWPSTVMRSTRPCTTA